VGIKSALRLSLYAGLSSLFATLLYQASESFLALPAPEKMQKLETIAIVSIGIQIVIEPLFSRLTFSPHEGTLSKRGGGILARFLSLVVIVLVQSSDGLLHEYLSHTISPHGLFGIASLVASLIGPSIITFSWLLGQRKERPPRARSYGLYSAMFISTLYVTVAGLLLANYSLKKTPPPPGMEGMQFVEIETLIVLFALWPVLTIYWASGFFGGLAVDRRWCRHAWQGIAIGLSVATVVETVSVFCVGTVLYGMVLGTARAEKAMWSIWSPLPAGVIQNIGWALGIFLVSDADTLLKNEGTKPEVVSFVKASFEVACDAITMAVGIIVISLGLLVVFFFLSPLPAVFLK
jgi:hypothetical protein